MQEHTANGSATQGTIAQLSNSMEKTLDQNRELFAEMARFTQGESFRLVHRQLDRADQAFAQFHDMRDLPALIGVQQEWMREMMQEYAAQSLRYAQMFRTLARHTQAAAEEAVHEAEAESDAE